MASRPLLSFIVVALLLIGAGLGFATLQPLSTGDAGRPALATAPDPPGPRSTVLPRIAVLPFTDSAPQADLAALRHGIAETLMQRLGSSGEVDVVGRDSVGNALALDIGTANIAVLLNASHVLDGRMLLDGDRITLEAILMDGDSGAPLWQARHTGDRATVQRLPDVLEQGIRAHLRTHSPGQSSEKNDAPLRIAPPVEVPAEAHTAYLNGRFAASRRTAEGLQRSLVWYARALEIAPDHAASWAGMAESRQLLVWYAGIPPHEAFPQALKAAQRALDIDPGQAGAAAVLGLVQWTYQRDPIAAEASMRRAVALNPGGAHGYHALGQLLAATGRMSEAETVFARAVALEPLSLVVRTDYATAHLFAGELETAVSLYDYVLELDPNFALARVFLAIAHIKSGQPVQAIGELEHAIRVGGRAPLWLAVLAHAHASAGRAAEARAVLGEIDGVAPAFISPAALALVEIALGDRDAALDLLDRAFAKGDPFLIYLQVYPQFDGLRGDPRYDALLERSGLFGANGRGSDAAG